MGKSQETFNKKEKEKKKLRKKKEKMQKKEDRKANSSDGSLENMMAYVDEYGNIVDSPPDISQKEEVDADDIIIGIPKKDESEVPAIRKGKIEYFNDSKGFGFIREEGTNEKIFVHVKGLLDDVQENDRVTYDLERGLKGMNAVRVKRI
jgi:cold shock CspA family protein